jgi:hypothetical protein
LLDQHFPGGWQGGALPARGFWGIGRRVELHATLLELLLSFGKP